jgi:hypothetical protein
VPKSPRSEAELPDLIRDREPAPVWRRVLYGLGAGLCFAAGIAGWVIPVVTGIPFWVGGFVLLAMASQRTRHAINAGERKLPPRWRTKLRTALGKVKSRRLRGALNLPERSSRAA